MGSEGLPERFVALPEGSEGLQEGSEGLSGGQGGGRTYGQMYGCTDGRTDRISPHSTGLHPLLGPLPRRQGKDTADLMMPFGNWLCL